MDEVQNLDHDENSAAVDHRSNVDTSRPFRSVKEAVAIFGERFLAGEINSPKPFSFPKQETPFFSPSPRVDRETPSWKYSFPSPGGSSYSHETTLVDTVKKIEAELEEAKAELKILKKRESETEIALASLNAELQRSMSKVAQAETVATAGPVSAGGHFGVDDHGGVIEKEENKKDLIGPSFAKVLSLGEKESLFIGRKKEWKKKPVIPLVGDLFSKKKGSSTTLHNPFYASQTLHYN